MITLSQLINGGILLYSLHTTDSESKPTFDIYRQRTMNGLSPDTQDIIRLITFSDSTEPVGSFKYRVHRYPGDIDIFEPVKICCTKQAALTKITSELKDIARRVKKSKLTFWGDFKAGLDTTYNPDDRDRYIVRWTADEVIQGQKTISSGKILSLADAITHKTIIKLDLWSPVNGNYTEITNFFIFMWTDGKEDYILNAELEDRIISLNKDIQKYSSAEHWNPLKLAKRLWNKALFEKNRRVTEELYPLFSSGAAIINQIAGECETLAMMFAQLNSDQLPINKINKQIIGFKHRINNAADINLPDEIYQDIDKISQSQSPKAKIADLINLQHALEDSANLYTEQWLKQNTHLF